MDDLSEALYECMKGLNRTELYQLCRKAKAPCNPAHTEHDLKLSLITRYAGKDDVNTIDDMRDALIAFISLYWRALQPQLKCPAKDLKNADPGKANPRPCYGCCDMQVIACVATQNDCNVERITKLRRKKL